MDFLNPMFLFLLGAAGLPLIIHLLSRRKVREVRFSSLRFISSSDRRSMRKMNLRKLLLLLLRMAALACAALAFSRPVITGGLASLFPGSGPKDICILLDRSCSMALADGRGEVMRRAAGSLEEIAGSVEDGDEVAVMLFDQGTEILFEGERFTPATAAGMAGEIEASYLGTSIDGALGEGMSRLKAGRRAEKELYIVSDFQRSGISIRRGASAGGPAAGRGGTAAAGGPEADGESFPVRTFLVPVQPEPGQNVAIEEVLTPAVAVHRGETVMISVVVRNHSEALGARFPLRVSLDGSVVMEREVSLAPAAALTERFEIPVERSGWVRGEVFKTPDRQRRDDRRFFTLHVREKAQVLLLGGGDDIYLEAALSPGEESGDIELRMRSWEKLTTADLEQAEVVVAGSGAPGSDTELDLVRRFADRGGKVLVFLTGDDPERIAGLSANDISIRRLPPEGMRTIRDPGEVPRLLRPFGREDITGLTRLRFSGGVEAGRVPGEDVVLEFRDGSPFMWRESFGRGLFIFIVADPDPQGGELVLSPYFLPLVQQAVLAGGPREPAAGGLETGEETLAAARPGAVCTVIMADGTERDLFPSAPALQSWPGDGDVPEPAMPAERSNTVVVPAGRVPGHIEVLQDGETLFVAAVNPPVERESLPGLMSPAEAADSLGLRLYAVLSGREALSKGIRVAREGREISAWFAVAAIALLSAELVIAQRRDMAV